MAVAALAMTACNKDGDDNRVDVSQLAGTWVYFNDDPRLEVDGSVTYSFYGEGGYWKFVHDALSDTVAVHRGTYEITDAETGKRITLRDEEGDCEGEYFFLRLTSRSMKWREVVYGAKPRVESFERVDRNVLPKIHDDAAMLTGVWDGECKRTFADGDKHTEGIRLTLKDGKYLCRSTTNDALVVGLGEYKVFGNKFVFRTGNVLDAMHDWWSSEPLLLDGECPFTLQEGILTFGMKKGGEYYVYRLARHNEGIE